MVYMLSQREVRPKVGQLVRVQPTWPSFAKTPPLNHILSINRCICWGDLVGGGNFPSTCEVGVECDVCFILGSVIKH